MDHRTEGEPTMTRPARNGIDGPSVFAVIDGVKGQPGMAQFQFRDGNKWIDGTHNRSVIQGLLGRGQEDISRTEPFTYDVAHPAVLIGDSNGPAAVGFPLHATAGCLTSGLANVAAAHGVTPAPGVRHVRDDIDLLGILGLSDTVRNGCRQVRVSFEVEGDTSRRNSPHWSSGPGRGRPSMTCWSTAPMSSSTSPHHRWPDSASAHRLLNGSTPDPGTPGAPCRTRQPRGSTPGPDHRGDGS
jgi:hypothetical protein